jgi:hypothetical protein
MWIRPFVVTTLLAWAAGASADERPAGHKGIFFGARLGFALPAGNVETTDPHAHPDRLSNDFIGTVPLTLELGYRLGPRLSLLGTLQYGLGILNGSHTGDCIECAGRDLSAGAGVQFHATPLAGFAPWLGLGLGYEKRLLSGSNAPATFLRVSESLAGLQFLNLEVGADRAASPAVSVGPFLGLSLGTYLFSRETVNAEDVLSTTSESIPNTALHAWVTLGVRCRFSP